MLLGSNQAAQSPNGTSLHGFIARLINQSLYADAYVLLIKEAREQTVTQYNLALCFYHTGSYTEALLCLDKAQAYLPVNPNKNYPVTDAFHTAMLEDQHQLNDHLFALTAKHVQLLPQKIADSIIRLKTDCWMQLGNYAKVIEIATPVAYKQYGNITEALAVAKKHLNQ